MVKCNECGVEVCDEKVCNCGKGGGCCEGVGNCRCLTVFNGKEEVYIPAITLCRKCDEEYKDKKLKEIPKKFKEMELVWSI